MKVLAPMLDSAESRAALDAAAEQATTRGAELVLVGYLHTPTDERTSRQFSHDRDQLAADIERRAEELRQRGLQVSVHVPVGVTKASQAILRVADQEKVDLIVIGVRRRTPVGKVLLGSLSQDVILEADAPVLAVKAGEH